MKISVLVENKKRADTTFLKEHGLSLYFEADGKCILFDTGASDAFIYNATLLGIDLAKVDICVLSHAHADHTGGLASFLEINRRAKVFMKTTAADDFYSKRLFGYDRTGIDAAMLKKYAKRITYTDKDISLTKSVTLSSVNKYRRLPQYSSLMYKKTADGMVRDDLSHELFISVKTKKGTIVLTGCSHNGLINILQTAAQSADDIYGVVGGFHLSGIKRFGFRVKKESSHEIRAIVKYFDHNRISKVYTGHCTGEKPLEKLQMLSRTQRFYSGDIFEI